MSKFSEGRLQFTVRTESGGRSLGVKLVPAIEAMYRGVEVNGC